MADQHLLLRDGKEQFVELNGLFKGLVSLFLPACLEEKTGFVQDQHRSPVQPPVPVGFGIAQAVDEAEGDVFQIC